MRRSTVALLFLLVLVAVGAGLVYFEVLPGVDLIADPPEQTANDADTPAASPNALPTLAMTPQEVDLTLTVELPKRAGGENPDRQEISASGQIDFSARDVQLTYDFEGLANAAGLLGHFETLDVLYADGIGYMKIFVDGPPWLSFEPEDASNPDVLRLREVMLTTPMLLPGLLDAAAPAGSGSESPSSTEIDVASLTDADDDITAGIASALGQLGTEEVTLEVAVDSDGDSEIVLAFAYAGSEGQTDVQVIYEISPMDEPVSVEAPKPSRVRTFSSLFG